MIAIDPGANGGIAWTDENGNPQAVSMPATVRDVRKALVLAIGQTQHKQVFIEKVGGYIAGTPSPGSAAFTFGYNAGVLEGLLCYADIPYEFVLPVTWQKPLGLGGRKSCDSPSQWKNKLKAAAQRKFPTIDVTLKTADALLIWDWAQTNHGR